MGTRDRDIVHLNKNNKKEDNSIVTTKKVAITLATLATTIMLVVVGTAATIPLVPHWMSAAEATTEGVVGQDIGLATEPKAPMAVSENGSNVYIVWWTNRTGNWEVMFRASNDSGLTFGEAINLSNSSDAESQNAEIVSLGADNVAITWWESSPETGSSESVLRVSFDSGQTFGPILLLGTNGTISATETTEPTATTNETATTE